MFVDDALAQSASIPEDAIASFRAGGTRVGVAAAGLTRLEEFVNWPCRVPIPPALAERLPPVPLRADGEIILHDDFEGSDSLSLAGRRPKIGRGSWHVVSGDWYLENGAARIREKDGNICKQGLGEALIDCGASDIEISATIEFPTGIDRDFPHLYNNWFPGLVVRADSARPSGHVNPRYLWQNGSPENRAQWRETETGPWAGHTASVLVGGSNITSFIRPGETHVLRLVVRGNRLSAFRDDVLVSTAPTRVTDRAGTWVGLNIAHLGNTGCRWHDLTVREFKEPWTKGSSE